MKKALVIGSEGNIGAPLVAHLRGRGYEVLETDIRSAWRDGYMMADINHPIDLIPAFDWGPDVVFVLASIVSRVTCEQAGSLAIATNLTGINNVAQLCKRAGATMIYFSTSEIYGPECDPMDERESDPRPNNRYGLSKLLGEQLIEYEVRSHGLKAVTLRPFMIYDERESLGDHRSAMIRFVSNLASGVPIEVHSGSARSWLHVSDALSAIEAAASIEEYSVINIGHPDVVPIAELAEMIRVELDASPDLVRTRQLPEKMTLIKRPLLDRQQNILGVVPEVSLPQGIKLVTSAIKERFRRGEEVRR